MLIIETLLPFHRVDFLRRTRSFDGIAVSVECRVGGLRVWGLAFWWRHDLHIKVSKECSSFVDVVWHLDDVRG